MTEMTTAAITDDEICEEFKPDAVPSILMASLTSSITSATELRNIYQGFK